MDLIADRQPVTFIWILEKDKIIQSLSKHPFISNKFDIEFIELPIEVSDFIDEDSKKLDIAMCIFRDKATAPGRKKILEIPLREEL